MAAISNSELENYLSKIYNQLLITYNKEEANRILAMLRQSALEFLEENPNASFEDFQTQYGDIDEFSETTIFNANSTDISNKLDKTRIFKKFLISIIIILLILSCIKIGLYIKSYKDVQNSLIDYEVIEIN